MHDRWTVRSLWSGTRRGTLALLGLIPVAAVAILAIVFFSQRSGIADAASHRPEAHPQTTWARCNLHAHSSAPSTFKPLSDAAAAALVTREPETRPDNAKSYTLGGRTYPATTTYVPTQAQLRAFRSTKTSLGQGLLQFNPYMRYVDGRDGLRSPSTDDLIQWAAHKWGIPENWLRAEYVVESYWSSYQLGDLATVSPSVYNRYPLQARVPGTDQVYQSLGITQVKWDPSGSVGTGAEPLRWESMAFNIDYQAATVRFFYDNPGGARTSWGDKSYSPCEKWNSIGGWFSSYPWANQGQANYVHAAKTDLASTAWRSGSFLSWSPPSLPPGIKLR